MKITNLHWISENAKEAELTITDGIHSCLVFSQPCTVSLNENITDPLHAIEIEDLMKLHDLEKSEEITKTNESYFSHYCIAKVMRTDIFLVTVGNIIIELECAMPGWLKEGDKVEFKCSRLDIW